MKALIPQMSVMSQNRVGDVLRFEAGNLFATQLQTHGGHSIGQVMRFSSADDRGRHTRFMQEPCQSYLCCRKSVRLGYIGHCIDYLLVGFPRVKLVCVVVLLRTLRAGP